MTAPHLRPGVSVPEVGQLVRVRNRAWVVADVQASSTLHGELPEARQHLLELTSVGGEDDGLDDDLTVIWEIEPGATGHGQRAGCPFASAGRKLHRA